ncbi:ependymin-1-like [Megalops cyprinoides]|uniref:ependymin-1-like n=1 Tax=Megalops cyprinoides TaxID=118141 RepID=UPI001863B025|nr:ependymin-1-like [Megalops cyprinoides]
MEAGPNGTVASVGKYSYDAYGRRIRFSWFGYDQSGTYSKDVLMLFNEGVSYEINWLTFTCTKRALKTPFHPMEVPKDAALMGQVVVGSSSGYGQGVLVNTWIAEDPETQSKGDGAKYMTTFTEIACVPMTTMYYTAETGWMALSPAGGND